jgi:hypothetical protein
VGGASENATEFSQTCPKINYVANPEAGREKAVLNELMHNASFSDLACLKLAAKVFSGNSKKIANTTTLTTTK